MATRLHALAHESLYDGLSYTRSDLLALFPDALVNCWYDRGGVRNNELPINYDILTRGKYYTYLLIMKIFNLSSAYHTHEISVKNSSFDNPKLKEANTYLPISTL
jgi:hypothetical protein